MRIKHRLISAEVKEIKPRIFAVIVKDNYDRAMLFCRYQEFYESPFKEIQGRFFTLEDLMRIYTKKNKKPHFTYPSDWGGYNIPSNVLYDAVDTFGQSLNEYDYIMREIIYFCEKKSKDKPFYLIGVDKIRSKTMDHEIAHGLYHTNLLYKKSVDKLILELPKKEYDFVKKILLRIGYRNNKVIIDDEIQAFFSTGLINEFNTKPIKRLSKKFENNFKSFM